MVITSPIANSLDIFDHPFLITMHRCVAATEARRFFVISPYQSKVSPAPLGQTALCCVATVLPDFVFRRVAHIFTASVRFAIAEDKVYAMKERISQSIFCAWRRTAIFAFARCREHIQPFPRRIPTASCHFCSETLCHLYLNMTSLTVNLALFVYHLSVVSASFILFKRLGSSILPNNFIRNYTLAPLSVLNLTAATAPPGFLIDINYIGTEIFVPMEMYIKRC